MELNINISPTMNKENGWNDEYECRIIRIPLICRDEHNLKIGEFLYLRTTTGGVKMLQIAEAYKEDVLRSPNCSYVTTEVEHELFTKNCCANGVSRVANITLGCDPEAFLIDNNSRNIVAAHRFMRKYGDVGHDGLLIEFRPNPSVSAEEVCNNLWALIKKARWMLNAYSEGNRILMVAGSSWNGLTAGFHLHYGMPRGLLGNHPNVDMVARLMTVAFDYYVGVPSIIPEGNVDITRRTVKFVDYGKPGGYCLDNRTFEFRMPGGVNMKHPLLARGLLALGATVAEDVASRINTCTNNFMNLNELTSEVDLRVLYPNLPDIHTFYGIICNPDISAAKAHFQQIKYDVRQMLGYEQRAEAVESYFKCIEDGIEFGNNIEQNWGEFYNEKQQGQMVVL
jgi:hypothetical protein